MIRSFLALVAVLALAAPALAQPIWSDVAASRAQPRDDVRAYRLVRLDAEALRARLAPSAGARRAEALPMPLPDGGFAEVAVEESSVMAAPLQARYPEIRTYATTGALVGRFAMTPAGLTALLYAPSGPLVIEPVGGDLYAVFHASDLVVPDELLAELADDVRSHEAASTTAPAGRSRTGETLRTYRLAVSARAEFTQARSNGTVAGGLAAVVASVNRVNALFERDMAVRFVLVADNDQLIFTDPNTDPFTGRGEALLSQNQAAVDAAIGPANYDVGHVLGFDEAGGVAYLGVTCNATLKAQGVSGVGSETTLFDLLVFPHELGHMLGAPHAFVQYAPGTPYNANGVEPGPGYTMMSYGQFASYRPADEQIGFHFHASSLNFMNSHVRGAAAGCGVDTATGNDTPVVSVPRTLVRIPVETPFMLQGTATDASPMTFVWEQMNSYGGGTGALPLFRSVDPGPEPVRFFPDLARELDGTPYPDETLPTGTGSYSFRLTARDGEGGVGHASIVVATLPRTEPFEITSQTRAAVYEAGSPIEVTWNVADTDQGVIGATEVDVWVSADGGETWTVALAATPNDGEATVTAPDAVSGRGGFLLVRPTNNVFYARSEAAFTIGAAPVAGISDRSLDLRVAPGATGSAALTVENQGPSGSELVFSLSIAELRDVNGAVLSLGAGYDAPRTSADAGGPAADLTDISGSGTALAFSNDDDGAAAVALPFGFPFYGETYTSLAVMTNGFVQFAGSTPGAYQNVGIPTASDPNAIIAPFWDDLRLEGGAVYTATLADGRFAIQWNEVGRYVQTGDSGASYTFQLLLGADGSIEVQYGTMTGPTTGATIGIENAAGDDGIQLAFNTAYAASQFAVRIAPLRSWLSVIGGGGRLAGGTSAEVGLALDAAGVAAGGRLTGELVLQTNDGALAELIIPVVLDVSSVPVAADEGPEAAVVSLVAPNPATGRAALTVALAAPGAVRATLHDVLGREVARLHEGPATGTVSLGIDAAQLAPGAYVVRVVGDGFEATRRLVVVR